MNASIIAIANQKGGVAKTTTTHNLGVAMALTGKNVLLVDLDSQASLTISVGIEPQDIPLTICDIMRKNGVPAKDCINHLSDHLDIITSIIDLSGLEMDLLSRVNRERILDRAIAPIKNQYDYILIDCPPQLSILTLNALSCADQLIVPVKTDYLAYRGLSQLLETVDEVKAEVNPCIEINGVIATIMDIRVKSDHEVLDLLQKNYNVLGVVKYMAATKRGVSDGKSVVEADPQNPVAIEYQRIAQIIMEGDKGL